MGEFLWDESSEKIHMESLSDLRKLISKIETVNNQAVTFRVNYATQACNKMILELSELLLDATTMMESLATSEITDSKGREFWMLKLESIMKHCNFLTTGDREPDEDPIKAKIREFEEELETLTTADNDDYSREERRYMEIRIETLRDILRDIEHG